MAEAPPNPELLALRDRIDAVDREVLAALNRRAGLAQQVGAFRKETGEVGEGEQQGRSAGRDDVASHEVAPGPRLRSASSAR